MPARTWSHRLARAVVRPLVGTGVTPNHLTTLRLISGLASCVGVGLGSRSGAVWGAGLWMLSAFLDRADGELARIGDMKSAGGHRYDYIADVSVNSLLFAAAGFGARHGWLGRWSTGLGALAALSMAICWVAGEAFQSQAFAGEKPYPSMWGFDLDDGLYLLGPLILFQLMSVVVLGAAVTTSIMAVAILVRLKLFRSRVVREDRSRG